MRSPAGFAPTEPASDVPPEPPQANGFNDARIEAMEAIAARGREQGRLVERPARTVERGRPVSARGCPSGPHRTAQTHPDMPEETGCASRRGRAVFDLPVPFNTP